MADIFVSMKTVTKRELVRNPSLVSHIKPGESIEIAKRAGKEPLVVTRRKKRKLSADEIHAELDRIWKNCPPMDCQAVLADPRK